MKIPHTYLSTRFRPGKRAIRRRLADLFAPARRRGTVPLLLVLFCVAGLGALVACGPDASSPSGAVPTAQEALALLEERAPMALGLEAGSLTAVSTFSAETSGRPRQFYELYQGEELAAEASLDLDTGALLLRPAGDTLTVYLSGPELPQGALDFRAQLEGELAPRYSTVDPDVPIEAFYLGDYLSQEFSSVWGFRLVQRQGDGWRVVDDYYQVQEDKQVLNVSYDLAGLLSYLPGTFRFPETFSDPEERFYPEFSQRVRRLSQELGADCEIGEMSLAQAVYFSPDDVSRGGYDGAAAYFCPVTCPDQPGWTDEVPYAVYLHTYPYYHYLGRFSAQEAGSEEALAALAAGYFQEMAQPYWGRYLPTLAGEGVYYDPEAAVFTSDALHFTWELPDSAYTSYLIFRPTEGGVAVYDRSAYEAYVSRHGGVEPADIQPGSGCLVEVLAGPEDPYPTLPEGREVDMLGRSALPGVPGGNGWYYLPVTDPDWYPPTPYWEDYQQVLDWITSRAVFTLY